MGKKSKRKGGPKKAPSSKSLPPSKGKKFPSSALAPSSKPASEKADSQAENIKQEEPLYSFVEEPLPKNFYWFLALMGVLFVAFLITEPFYRQ